MDREFVTLGGVVDILGVSKTRVEQLLIAGMLPTPEWFGKLRYWQRADIERIAEKRAEVRARRVADRAALREVVGAAR